jgi:hypothetical protein
MRVPYPYRIDLFFRYSSSLFSNFFFSTPSVSLLFVLFLFPLAVFTAFPRFSLPILYSITLFVCNSFKRFSASIRVALRIVFLQ